MRNGKKLFQNLGITLFPGCILCIHGANGSGKTSLLRALIGLTPHNTGCILYNDVNIYDAMDEYASIITYIGHHNALDLELTVEQNLKFWAKLRNMQDAMIASLEIFGLHDIMKTKVRCLSHGWQRRIELTKLLLTQTVVWFLDEPFANLDQDAVSILLELVKTRCVNFGIVILTSQEPIQLPEITNIMLEIL